MTTELRSLFAAALELPSADRVELAERHWESLEDVPPSKTESDWDDEIRLRIDEHRAVIAKAVPWEEARKQIWADGGDETD